MQAGRTFLNWTDGSTSLGGSVLRPKKRVWLEERAPGNGSAGFEIYQVYDNLIRRTLRHVGLATERQLEAVSTKRIEEGLVCSVKPWNLPVPRGMRLRAIYEFRNDSGLKSPQLMAHRLGRVDLAGEAGAEFGLEHLTGLPIGVDGRGELRGDVLFATDPSVNLRLITPWQDGGGSISDLVRQSVAETQAGLDPGDALLAFEQVFADYLPKEPPQSWDFELPDALEGAEGERASFSIRLDASAPGRALFAVEARDVSRDWIACSEILGLQVTDNLDILLLAGAEIASEQVEIIYARGDLSAKQIQAEIDQLWRELSEDPDLAGAVAASGIEVGELDRGRVPLRALEAVAGMEPGSILVVASGVVARDLWREVLLPRIKERLGATAVRQERRQA